MTGSRFPDPGYKITNSSIDLTRHPARSPNPNTGKEVKPKNPKNPETQDPTTRATGRAVWRVDARQNIYFAGPIPVFYWPHVVMDLDDLEPPLRMIGFATTITSASSSRPTSTGSGSFRCAGPSSSTSGTSTSTT